MKNLLALIKYKTISIGLKGYFIICFSSLIIGSFVVTIISNLIQIGIYDEKTVSFKLEYLCQGFVTCFIPMIIFFYFIED